MILQGVNRCSRTPYLNAIRGGIGIGVAIAVAVAIGLARVQRPIAIPIPMAGDQSEHDIFMRHREGLGAAVQVHSSRRSPRLHGYTHSQMGIYADGLLPPNVVE